MRHLDDKREEGRVRKRLNLDLLPGLYRKQRLRTPTCERLQGKRLSRNIQGELRLLAGSWGGAARPGPARLSHTAPQTGTTEEERGERGAEIVMSDIIGGPKEKPDE